MGKLVQLEVWFVRAASRISSSKLSRLGPMNRPRVHRLAQELES